MMKVKNIAMALCCSGLFVSVGALADNHTASIGYAQSKIEGFNKLNGINAQYRYEWDSPVSIIGSLSYMTGDDSYSELTEVSGGVIGYNGSFDVKYYSFLVGPAYRINDYVSLYALAGMAHIKVNEKISYFMLSSTPQSSEEYKSNKSAFAYGAGVVINPTDYLSVNIGYEGTQVKYNDNVTINGFNVGFGYRF